MRLRRDRPEGVDAAEREGPRAQRQKNSHGTENRDDLEQNHEELKPVGAETDLGMALAHAGVDRLEMDAVAGPQERQSGRRRRRETVGKEMQELQQRLAARRPESRRQIRYRVLSQVAGDRVQKRIPDPPGAVRLRGARSRADDEVVVAEPVNESNGVRRAVLAVTVEDQHDTAGCLADARLDGSSIALVVRMADDTCASLRGPR